MNFARLNHILIPQKAEHRLALRNSKRGWFIRAALSFYNSLTPFGMFLFTLWMMITPVSMSLHITVYYVVWSIISSLLLVSFLIRPSIKTAGLSVRVSNPPRIRVNEEIHFTLTLENNSPATLQALEIEGPFLPWDGHHTLPPPHVHTLGANEKQRLNCRARFRARGRHSLMPFTARQLAPLGITRGNPVESNLSFFTVVPIFPTITGLRVPSSPKHQPGGVALASRTGEALELMGVRPYQSGDRIRDLHPATWARTGIPHVRHYHQEYFNRVAVVLDMDTRGGAVSERRFEASVSLAAGFLSALEGGESLVDLIVCCENAEPITIGRRMGSLDMALDILACLNPRGAVNPDTLKDRLTPLLPRLSMLVYVSLADDARCDSFSNWVSERGVPNRVFAAGTGNATGSRVHWIPLEAIETSAEVQL